MPESPTTSRVQTGLFLLILVVYFVVAGLFAVFTPAWEAPDEPAHYNYVAQVVQNGCCPVLEQGDWNSAYLDQIKAARFAPSTLGNLSSVQYEDHEPPLYYLLEAPIFSLSNGSLVAMRLLSVVLGAGIVTCAYGLALVVLPRRPQVALATAALVAFLPQHLAILASMTNDALSNLIIAMTLLGTVAYLKGRNIPVWQLGLLVGLGLLTKVSTLFLGGVVGLAILLKWWHSVDEAGKRPIMALIRPLVIFAVPALILGGVWWIHDINVYGFPDVFGLRRHDTVVADQPRTADLIAQIGWSNYLTQAVQTTYNSFWGQFGWMALPLPQWAYLAIDALLVACIAGLFLSGWEARRTDTEIMVRDTGDLEAVTRQRDVWIILLVTILLALLAYIYYNTVFLQLQGRYMFTGLIPFALVLALGLDNLFTRLREVSGRRLRPYLADVVIVPFALFGLLDVYLLWRVIIPALKV